MFKVFFGNFVNFFRLGVEPSSDPVKSTVLRRRFLFASFFALIFRFLIFFARREWQSFTLKSKSLSRSLSVSLALKSEKSDSLSASSSSDDRSAVFSVELVASSTLRLRAEFDVSLSKPFDGNDFDNSEFRAFFFVVVLLCAGVVGNFDLFFASRFALSAVSSDLPSLRESAYV